MSFFSNHSINLLNIHSSIQRFSVNILFMFGMIYLLEQGLSIPVVFITWAGIYLTRILIRPLSLKLSLKIGLKKASILGTFFYAGTFLILSQVQGLDTWLIVFMLYWGIADTLYWLPFHSYYAAAGDEEHRGKHTGARDALATILIAFAPIITAFLITQYSYNVAYILATFVGILSVIPLFYAKDFSAGKSFTFKEAKEKIDKRGFFLLLGDGIICNSHFVIWIIVLYFLVDTEIMDYGWFMGLELLLSAIFFLSLGKAIDMGKGWKITQISAFLFSIIIVARALFVDTNIEIIIFQTLAALGICFYNPSLNTAFYNLAQKSGNTLWYHYFGELGWDLGAIFSLASAATFVYFGGELQHVMLLALIGIVIVLGVLRSYYKK